MHKPRKFSMSDGTRPWSRRPQPSGPATARRFAMAIGLIALALIGGAQAAPLELITVVTNQAKIVRLPEQAQTIIVGNPSVADVSLQKNNVLVVTGKSFGMTNIIALDGKGIVVGESQLRVEASRDDIVMVQHGLQRQSYICAPVCEPTLIVGDDTESFKALKSQIEDRNALASGK